MRFVDALYDNDANDIGSRMSSETRVIVTLSYDLLERAFKIVGAGEVELGSGLTGRG
jgi:hypothetical protein